MATTRYVHWQDGTHWLGYIDEFPDYLTQGETFEDLQENLKDLYLDLTKGDIPGIRRVAEIAARPAYALLELVNQITPENRHGEKDWGKPSGRELW